jgi:hypothetical protein
MRTSIIIFVILLFLVGIAPAHHDSDSKVLDNIVKQSIRNYKLSEECKAITNCYLK